MFVLEHIWQLMAIIYLSQQKQLLEFYSMGHFQQRYRDHEYDLEEQLNRMLPNQLMFNLGHIWQQMAMTYQFEQKQLLEFCSMDRYQQHCRDREYDLVELLDRMLLNRLMFSLEHIWLLMAIIF